MQDAAPPSHSSSPLLFIALLLIAILSVQSGAAIAKSLFPIFGAEGMAAMRLALSAVIISLILRPWRAVPPAGSRRPIILYGLSLGVMNLAFYAALSRIPLGIAVALEFSGPLAVALLDSRRLVDFAWVGLAVIGLLLLLPIDIGVAALDPLGVACALVAGLFWALYIVFGQKAGRAHGPTSAAWGMMIGALLIFPVGLADKGAALFTPALLPMVAAVALLSSVLPYTLEMIVLRHLPARSFGTMMSLEPAVGALAGLLLLDERLTPIQWTAIIAIVIASIGTTTGLKQETLPAPN
ncbi:EamA family transporter [Sphingomonas oleivorans]|uniref:EamA family transporter n=1 Tax=Sphingomonas oleivorans TaxID=1735121 RepID=A0A2T5G0L9_9SPHN|nr:EamA family transporter [Sphingomonas oleivorans]PTQ12688.1 EamA family transporter [Sphingomonas oleivorans]